MVAGWGVARHRKHRIRDGEELFPLSEVLSQAPTKQAFGMAAPLCVISGRAWVKFRGRHWAVAVSL